MVLLMIEKLLSRTQGIAREALCFQMVKKNRAITTQQVKIIVFQDPPSYFVANSR